MSEVQIFHATLDGARELEATPFRRERDLQRFIEFHLDDLFGIEFLDTEHSTGPHDKQRIDSLGIDARGRPVVIEYKLRSDKNIINQGLGYLDWLDKHPESIELLAMKKLGPDKAQRVDLKRPRLLCIAGAFTRNDIVTAENCRASVELVRYCRYGDTSLLLEWVHGGRTAPKVEKEKETRRPSQEEQQSPEEPDFSKYRFWSGTVANEELHSLFLEFVKFLSTLGGNVWIDTQGDGRQFVAKCRRNDFFNICYFKPQPRETRIYLKIPGRDGPKLYIHNLDEIEGVRVRLQRSYEEAVKRSKG